MTAFHSLTDVKVVGLLNAGEVGILPTDTIYGLTAKATDPSAVASLYRIKQREGKPGTLIAASLEQLEALGIQRQALESVAKYWPGPLSVVLPVSDALDYLSQGQSSLAVRIPANPNLRTLLEQTGPLLTSSANFPGEPHANTVQEAQAYFGDSVAFYVDGGSTAANLPSTVARLVGQKLEVLRQGAAHINEEDL